MKFLTLPITKKKIRKTKRERQRERQREKEEQKRPNVKLLKIVTNY